MTTLEKVKAWEDAQKAFGNEKSSEYNWRKDAERLYDLYTYASSGTNGYAEQAGDYSKKFDRRDYHNTITTNGRNISIHRQVYMNNRIESDLVEEANLFEINEIPTIRCGAIIPEKEMDISIVLQCALGECVRWNGWQTVGDGPTATKVLNYHGEAVMSYLEVSIHNIIDDKVQKVFINTLSRLISTDHQNKVSTLTCCRKMERGVMSFPCPA